MSSLSVTTAFTELLPQDYLEPLLGLVLLLACGTLVFGCLRLAARLGLKRPRLSLRRKLRRSRKAAAPLALVQQPVSSLSSVDPLTRVDDANRLHDRARDQLDSAEYLLGRIQDDMSGGVAEALAARRVASPAAPPAASLAA